MTAKKRAAAPDPFDALADPTRREILDLLRRHETRTAGQLAAAFPRISRPAVSRHLRVLREAGFVIAHEDGREWRYRLNVAALARMHRDWFARFTPLMEASLQQLKHRAESTTQQPRKPAAKTQRRLTRMMRHRWVSPAHRVTIGPHVHDFEQHLSYPKLTEHPFLRLLGKTIYEVAFVVDYVQIHFEDYSVLTCVSDPVVRLVDANEVQFPGPGSRDALCRLIAAEAHVGEPRVENVTFAEGRALEITFSTGDVLAVPLIPIKPGWECINFSFDDGQLFVR